MTDWITVRDVELAYEVRGEGTPSFIWPDGFTSSRAVEDADVFLDWGRVAERRPLLRYDALGHGESGVLQEKEAYGYHSLGCFQLAVADADSHAASTWDDYRTWIDRIIDFLRRLG